MLSKAKKLLLWVGRFVHIQEETHISYNKIWYSLLIRHLLLLVLRHTSLAEGNNVSHGLFDKKADWDAISGHGHCLMAVSKRFEKKTKMKNKPC